MNHHDDQQEQNIVLFPEQKAISEQASEWIARLDQENPDQQTRREFARWINQDPAHREAFERLAALWDDLNVLTQMTTPRENRAIGFKAWFAASFESIQSKWAGSYAGVAVVSLVLVTVLAVAIGPAYQANPYRTAIGEVKQLVLPDGTKATLNTNSEFSIAYTDQRRVVQLIRGEAHFAVSHNPKRPFEVMAGEGVVRAVGTAFSVFYTPQQVEVIVDEGVVEIENAKDQPAANNHTNNKQQAKVMAAVIKPKLRAGSAAVFAANNPATIEMTHDIPLNNKLAWRRGLLIFENETLQSLVTEVSRYTDRQLIVADNASKNRRVGGQFKVGDTQAVLDALELGFGIKVQRITEKQIYLSAQ